MFALTVNYAGWGGDSMCDILHIFIYVISCRISYLEKTSVVIYFNTSVISNLVNSIYKIFPGWKEDFSITIYLKLPVLYDIFYTWIKIYMTYTRHHLVQFTLEACNGRSLIGSRVAACLDQQNEQLVPWLCSELKKRKLNSNNNKIL